MKTRIFLILIGLFTFLGTDSFGQLFKESYEAPDMETSYIGVTATKPYLKNGFASDGLWYGAAVKLAYVNAGFSRGNYHEIGKESLEGTRKGWMTHVTFTRNFLNYYNAKKLSVGTVRFVPFVEGGLSLAKIGNNGVDDKVISFGAIANVGLTVRMPLAFVEVRPNMHLLFNGNPLLKDDSQNGFDGLCFSPSVTIGVDGLFDILKPSFHHQTVHTRESRSKREVTSSYNTYDWGDADGDGNYTERVRVTNYRTTYWKEDVETDFNLWLIRPYWTLGAKADAWMQGFGRGQTLMYGPQLGLRFGMFGLDAYAMKGNASVESKVSEDQLAQLGHPDPDFSFSGQMPLTKLGGTVSLDLFKMGIPAQRRRKISKNIMTKYTSMYRFMGRFNYELVKRNGLVVYDFASAKSELSDLDIANPGTMGDPATDADATPETFRGIGFGFAFEMGAATLAWDYTWYKDAPTLNRKAFSLSANVPWAKVIRGLSAQAAYKKAIRKEKRANRNKPSAPADE